MESSPHESSTSPPRMIGSWVNRPIHYVSGHFQGQTIRAELKEIQKADLGRKYARVDRRPLDPPPVVQLKLYQVFNYGTDTQYERELCDYSEVQTLGLLCCVDLFPVPVHSTLESAQVSGREPRQFSRVTSSLDLPESSSSRAPNYHRYSHYGANPHTTATQNLSSSHENIPPLPSSAALTYFDGSHPITEDMKRTAFLSGALFVQPAVIDYNGRKALVFAFADLAVKAEGHFFLRYRCFDLFSRMSGHEQVPMQSECFGGQFRIYSTKEFPGLQASTELTKQLARYGVRLNTRETERKRKRKSPPSTSGSASMKGKERETDSDSDYE
ncbi:velvet factor-domain-containing protein [Pisolithus sp. B1]|nr:velvet factor-domain-containing protein [Pisolithus sp. B1]